MTNVSSAWKASTGLPDDIDMEITAAVFQYDSEYMNGTRLRLELSCIEINGEPDNEFTLKLSCGDQWEPFKGGKEAKRADGKHTNFNANSGYGTWFTHAVAFDGFVKGIKEDQTPAMADVWVGTQWHIGQLGRSMKDRTTGEMTTFNLTIPTAFVGRKGAGKGGSSSAGNKSASSKQSSTSALRDSLLELARQHDSHDDFVQAAFEVDGVGDDAETSQWVMDVNGAWFEK